VVSRTKINFGKILSTTQFIQKVINDKNEEFIFDGNFDGIKNQGTCAMCLIS